MAVATNGDVYSMISTGGRWEFKGNAFGGVTPGSPIVAVQRDILGGPTYAVQVDVFLASGDFYVGDFNYAVRGPDWTPRGTGNLFSQLPASAQSPVASMNRSSFLGIAAIMLESGDIYAGRVGGIPLAAENYRGNIFGVAINVEGKTWSGVKEGYRK